MKCSRILETLDSKGFRGLDDAELRTVEDHSASCAPCGNALAAAAAAAAMLESRAAVEAPAGPPPHFRVAVMDALRARRRTGGPSAEAFRNWWQASYSFVAAMVVVVLVLGTVAILSPREESEALHSAPAGLYSAETVLIDHRPPKDLNREQVFQVIYSSTGNEVKK